MRAWACLCRAYVRVDRLSPGDPRRSALRSCPPRAVVPRPLRPTVGGRAGAASAHGRRVAGTAGPRSETPTRRTKRCGECAWSAGRICCRRLTCIHRVDAACRGAPISGCRPIHAEARLSVDACRYTQRRAYQWMHGRYTHGRYGRYASTALAASALFASRPARRIMALVLSRGPLSACLCLVAKPRRCITWRSRLRRSLARPPRPLAACPDAPSCEAPSPHEATHGCRAPAGQDRGCRGARLISVRVEGGSQGPSRRGDVTPSARRRPCRWQL